jgi:hypothetical protein
MVRKQGEIKLKKGLVEIRAGYFEKDGGLATGLYPEPMEGRLTGAQRMPQEIDNVRTPEPVAEPEKETSIVPFALMLATPVTVPLSAPMTATMGGVSPSI